MNIFIKRKKKKCLIFPKSHTFYFLTGGSKLYFCLIHLCCFPKLHKVELGTFISKVCFKQLSKMCTILGGEKSPEDGPVCKEQFGTDMSETGTQWVGEAQIRVFVWFLCNMEPWTTKTQHQAAQYFHIWVFLSYPQTTEQSLLSVIARVTDTTYLTYPTV